MKQHILSIQFTTGTVKEVNDKGAIVTFEDGVEAFVPGRHMEKEDRSKIVKGDTVEFKVLEFNKEYRRLLYLILLFSEHKKKEISK